MLRSRAAECISHRITSSPFIAASCAMPPPICPAACTTIHIYDWLFVACHDRRDSRAVVCEMQSSITEYILTEPAPRTPRMRGSVVDMMNASLAKGLILLQSRGSSAKIFRCSQQASSRSYHLPATCSELLAHNTVQYDSASDSDLPLRAKAKRQIALRKVWLSQLLTAKFRGSCGKLCHALLSSLPPARC